MFFSFVFSFLLNCEINKVSISDSLLTYNYCKNEIYYAPEDSIIESIKEYDNGINVSILLNNGKIIVFPDLSEIYVSEKEKISKNQMIGKDSSITNETVFILVPFYELDVFSQCFENKLVLPIKKNTKIYSHQSGFIEKIGYDIKKGNYIQINYQNSNITYANLSSFRVKKQEKIEKNVNIAYTGFTGECEEPQICILFIPENTKIDYKIIYIQQ